MAIRAVVCTLSLFILVVLSAGQNFTLPPNTLVYGSVESNDGVNMTTYKIHINSTSTTSYQIQLIRMTPVDSDYAAKFFVAYNSTNFKVQSGNGYRTTYTIGRYEANGDYFVGIYASGVNYTYAIQYCPGTCSTFCPSLCSGQGGCNITSLTCTCDDTIYRWSGNDCSFSQAAEDGTKILGMTIAVFVVVIIILVLVCVALPIILILVCCCGVCVAAGVAANDGPRTREYRIIQTQEQAPLLHGQVVYKV